MSQALGSVGVKTNAYYHCTHTHSSWILISSSDTCSKGSFLRVLWFYLFFLGGDEINVFSKDEISHLKLNEY